ncbi:MAG TPA: aminopeptidase P family protein [Sandaracinaceae bacterium LLY-WYZ-13_1]|nr:aminopeptidase P family protein [Sandaracinaceae bacterium LLY-WYZ-13_1]
MQLESVPTEAVVARRRRLSERLEGPALICAGAPSPRNYPAAVYPFRASSHFLYLVGAPLPGAALLLDGGEATLFTPPHDPADELWHGPVPGPDAIAEATGCAVRDHDDLGDAIAGREVATVPAVDLATRLAQERQIGRPLAAPTDADRRLAEALVELRLVHDEAALAELRAAAEATDAAHRAGMAATRAGVLEAEVHAAMVAQLLRRRMRPAYNPIVTVHGEILHNEVYHHALAPGDLVLADVGAESVGGWAADVTRTWPVDGAFSSTQRTAYELVLAAQRAAIEACRPGARYRDVHLTAARALTEGLVDLGVLRGDVDELVADGVHALFFPHGVGHLLGLDVHDMEDLGDAAGYAPGRERSAQFGLSNLRLDRDLAPGMAVTIEPGFYQVPAILDDDALTKVAGDRLDRQALARFADVRGIRIEDDVLITEGAPEVLSASIPKAPADVEAAVG